MLLCGWPLISLSLFHSFFSLFFLFSLSILFHDWQRAFLVNQTIFHFVSSSYSPPAPPSECPSPSELSIPPPPPLFCCCAVSSLGWWSNQCSNQTWAEYRSKYGNAPGFGKVWNNENMARSRQASIQRNPHATVMYVPSVDGWPQASLNFHSFTGFFEDPQLYVYRDYGHHINSVDLAKE